MDALPYTEADQDYHSLSSAPQYQSSSQLSAPQYQSSSQLFPLQQHQQQQQLGSGATSVNQKLSSMMRSTHCRDSDLVYIYKARCPPPSPSSPFRSSDNFLLFVAIVIPQQNIQTIDCSVKF